MPGGPVAAGPGIGANAPKNKLTGVVMVRPFHPIHFAPALMHFSLFSRPLSPLFGYDTGTISGLQQMPDWLRTFGHPVPVSSTFPDGYGISSSQRSLVVSILSAGTFFGPFYHPAIFFCHLMSFV